MRACAIAVFILSVATSVPAVAQPQHGATTPTAASAPDTLTREARQRWDEGMRALAKRDYEAARVAFKQAYVLKPEPAVQRNLGICEVLSGHSLDGARSVSAFLRTNPSLTVDERSDIEGLLKQAESKIGRIEIRVSAAGSDVSVDGERVARSPLDHDWYVEPGEHRVVAEKGGERSEAVSVRVSAGERASVEIALGEGTASAPTAPNAPASRAERAQGDGDPAPSPAPADSSSPVAEHGTSTTKTAVVASGAALTAIAAGVSLAFAVKGSNASDDASRLLSEATAQYGTNPCAVGKGIGSAVCNGLASKNDERANANRIATISAVSSVTLGIATLATWLLWPQRTSQTVQAREMVVTPWFGPIGFGAIVQKAF